MTQEHDPFDQLVDAVKTVLTKLAESLEHHQQTAGARRQQVKRVEKALKALTGRSTTTPATPAQLSARRSNAAKAREARAAKKPKRDDALGGLRGAHELTGGGLDGDREEAETPA